MITIQSLVSVWGDTSISNCFHKHKKSLVKNSCRVCWGMPYGLGYGLGYGLWIRVWLRVWARVWVRVWVMVWVRL